MIIKAVLFDLIGTTVKETNPSFINDCFMKAFAANGISISIDMVKKHRGKDKADIINNLLAELSLPLNYCHKILNDYRIILENNMDNFSVIPGFSETMSYLKSQNIITGLGTGLTRDFLAKLIQHLGWENAGFDYIAASEDIGNGRPHPGMVIDMMNKFNIKPEEMLKVGDTFSDIEEGKNAGVKTAVILAGTQTEEELRKHNPDYIIHSFTELISIIK